MRTVTARILPFVMSCCVLAPVAGRERVDARAYPATSPARPTAGALPMAFEPNVGQTDARARFVARGRGYAIFLTDDGATLSLSGRGAKHDVEPDRAEGAPPLVDSHDEGGVLGLSVKGAKAGRRLVAERRLPGSANYLRGPSSEAWLRDVPTYAAVRWEGLYDGVDAVFYGTQSELEYDFVVAPGADASQIRLRFEGQRDAEVDDEGRLLLRFSGGTVRQLPATVYQGEGAARHDVSSRYVLDGDGGVRVDVGDYDRSKPLVVDPVIEYDDFLGGAQATDVARAVAVDASGAIFVAGSTNAVDFPVTSGAIQTANLAVGKDDAFVAKLSADGTTLLAATYLGGGDDDDATGIALDGAGHVFITGQTYSQNFPVTPGAFNTTKPSIQAGFLAELDASLTTIQYATYFGSRLYTYPKGLAYGGGSVFITGFADSSNFPTTPGAYDEFYNGGFNAFAMKWSVSPWSLAYATYFGGGSVYGTSVAVDAAGEAVIAGYCIYGGAPTTPGALDQTFSGSEKAFVAKLNPAGSDLAFSTYLGAGGDEAYAVAVDTSGAVYVAGRSFAPAFPVTPGAFQTTKHAEGWAGFVSKLAPSGGSLAYSTFLGGSVEDNFTSIALDASGAAYLAGSTRSFDFPTTTGAFDAQLSGTWDATAVKLSADGSSLGFSTLLGGGAIDGGAGVAVGASGRAVVVGWSASGDYPHANAIQTRPSDLSEATVTVLAADGTSLVASSTLGGRIGMSYELVGDLKVDAAGSAYVVGSTASPEFPTTVGSHDVTVSGEDAFVTKLAPDGASIVYSTYLGGSATDRATSVALGPNGEAIVAGYTYSPDFPVTAGAYDTTFGGYFDAVSDTFVTKLDAWGSTLVTSTFVGGSNQELYPSVAVDAAGAVYVASQTTSTDYPTTPGAPDTTIFGDDEIGISKLSVDGASLVYSTLLGGDGNEIEPKIAVTPDGSAVVAGVTGSLTFPTTPGAYQRTAPGSGDLFVTKLTPAGTAFAYSTYLGGSDFDEIGGLAVDAAGSAYVAGHTVSNNYPTTAGAYDRSHEGAYDGFVTKLTPSGDALAFSTLLGAESDDVLYGIAIGAGGSVWVTGYTTSVGYPTRNATDTTFGGGFDDAVVSELSADGSALEFSTFAGGNGDEYGYAPTVGPGGDVYVLGGTTSSDFSPSGFGVNDGFSTFVLRLGGLPRRGTDTPGITIVSTGTFFLRNSNSAGVADYAFGYGGGSLVPLAGDWNGDGTDTPGLYDPSTGFFFLRDSNSPGPADHVFSFGPGGAGFLPLTGDWDGDGADGVGVYAPSTGFFFLKNAASSGVADVVVGFGPGGAGFVPLAGDWDGDGTDTVGLYQPTNSFFFLRNVNAPGAADITFGFGPAGAGWTPIVGDWNGDGTDTAGLYVPASGTFFLKNSDSGGAADLSFGYGPPGARPLAGDWDGQ